MGKINSLTIKVTYTVEFSNIEADETLYKSLMDVYEGGGEVFETEKNHTAAAIWIEKFVSEDKASDWTIEIEDIS